MGFIRKRPDEIRRSFDGANLGIQNHGDPVILKKARPRQGRQTTSWPNSQLNYAFMEKCKEVVCRIPHPNAMLRRRGTEYRVSIMYWSRGAYIDIRQYTKEGKSTSRGILLHQDVLAQMLPEVIGALREVQMHDTREKDQIQTPEVIRG